MGNQSKMRALILLALIFVVVTADELKDLSSADAPAPVTEKKAVAAAKTDNNLGESVGWGSYDVWVVHFDGGQLRSRRGGGTWRRRRLGRCAHDFRLLHNDGSKLWIGIVNPIAVRSEDAGICSVQSTS